MNRCDNLITGTRGRTVEEMIEELLEYLAKGV